MIRTKHWMRRSMVPRLMTGSDSTVRVTLDSFPGSERAVHQFGRSPRMLGKQTTMAIVQVYSHGAVQQDCWVALTSMATID